MAPLVFKIIMTKTQSGEFANLKSRMKTAQFQAIAKMIGLSSKPRAEAAMLVFCDGIRQIDACLRTGATQQGVSATVRAVRKQVRLIEAYNDASGADVASISAE